MRSSEAIAVLADYLADEYSIDPRSVRADARLADDLGLDSLACLELVAVFEQAVGIAVPDDLLGSLETVGDLAEWLLSQNVDAT